MKRLGSRSERRYVRLIPKSKERKLEPRFESLRLKGTSLNHDIPSIMKLGILSKREIKLIQRLS